MLDPGDRSVQVHACHGRARQVEALRDAILHRLAEDPTLEPRDVIVMCPDIETFAPLIHATFGAGEVSDDEDDALPAELRPPDLRVRLADRSLRQTNPVLGAVAGLLDLADARLTASQVLDLADREPVRRRFRLDDDDVGRLEDWIAESGIRWGLDAEHRAPFKLADVQAGTWRRGLDRLLLGVTMTEDGERIVDGVLPLDDVDSGAIDLAGRFAELVDRLGTALATLQGPQPIAAWAVALADAADALCATGPRDAWQRAQLQRLLDATVAEADGLDAPIALGEVRALFAERLQGRPTRANFRTGHLTICTLVPMRSVPHRVVCLLGLDDGVFPRRGPRDGDDRLLERPARRRARRPQRGPPAAARRADGRGRHADRHLHGQRRADEPVAAARGAGRRAARRRRPHARRRRRRRGARPPPAAAVRPAQLRGRRADPGARVELRPRRPRRRPRARGRAGRAGPVPARPAAAARHADRRARGPPGVRRASRAGVPAPPARRLRPRRRGRDRGRAARSSSTRWSSTRSASACSTRGWTGPGGARRSSPRSRAGRSRRAGSGSRSSPRSSRSPTRSSRRRARGPGSPSTSAWRCRAAGCSAGRCRASSATRCAR